MAQLISFHGDPAIKEKYLARVKRHRELDLLAKGATGNPSLGEKGCAVACTMNGYDHSRYSIEIGVPEWLARLEDVVFEGLPVKESMVWPERFLAAIPVGVNLEPARHLIAIRRMDRMLELLRSLPEASCLPQCIDAVELVRRCHEAAASLKSCDWSKARSAAWSALSAARSAESAAASAASAAWSALSAARSALSSAASAAWSALSAARSALSAAASAASSASWSAAWISESNAITEVLASLHSPGELT